VITGATHPLSPSGQQEDSNESTSVIATSGPTSSSTSSRPNGIDHITTTTLDSLPLILPTAFERFTVVVMSASQEASKNVRSHIISHNILAPRVAE
jgi:hypothetical protein